MNDPKCPECGKGNINAIDVIDGEYKIEVIDKVIELPDMSTKMDWNSGKFTGFLSCDDCGFQGTTHEFDLPHPWDLTSENAHELGPHRYVRCGRFDCTGNEGGLCFLAQEGTIELDETGTCKTFEVVSES